MDIKSIIGLFIVAKREELKISQTELAKRSNLSRATLIKLESDGSNLTINNAYRLFKELKTDFSEFEKFLQKNLLSEKLESSSISNEDKDLLKAIIHEQN